MQLIQPLQTAVYAGGGTEPCSFWVLLGSLAEVNFSEESESDLCCTQLYLKHGLHCPECESCFQFSGAKYSGYSVLSKSRLEYKYSLSQINPFSFLILLPAPLRSQTCSCRHWKVNIFYLTTPYNKYNTKISHISSTKKNLNSPSQNYSIEQIFVYPK